MAEQNLLKGLRGWLNERFQNENYFRLSVATKDDAKALNLLSSKSRSSLCFSIWAFKIRLPPTSHQRDLVLGALS
jgi:hypothetical protein